MVHSNFGTLTYTGLKFIYDYTFAYIYIYAYLVPRKNRPKKIEESGL